MQQGQKRDYQKNSKDAVLQATEGYARKVPVLAEGGLRRDLVLADKLRDAPYPQKSARVFRRRDHHRRAGCHLPTER